MGEWILLKWNLNAQQLTSLSEKIITMHEASITHLVNNASPTFVDFVEKLDQIAGNIKPLVSSCIFPTQVHNDIKIRNASSICSDRLNKYFNLFGARADVWDKFAIAMKEDTSIQHDNNARRVVDMMHLYFKWRGMHLKVPLRESLLDIRMNISLLKERFQRNLAEDSLTIILSPEQLDGMDTEFISSRIKDGNVTIRLNYPDVKPILLYSKNHDTRLQVHKAFTCKGSPLNATILCEIVRLRAREAKILGYNNHAEMMLEKSIIGTPIAAKQFLQDVYKLIRGSAQKFVNLMKIWAKSDQIELDSASASYYSYKVLRDMHGDSNIPAEKYFAVQDVVDGTLQVYMELFNLKFTLIENVETWHPDVIFYEVRNLDGITSNIIGGFYLDLYVREGKFGHYAEFDLQSAFGNTKGVVCVVANFEKVADGKIPKLEFNEVKTFFHEFGHILHEICYKGKYFIHSGTSVEYDFVEAPSQMFENWCYQPQILRKLSGGKLPIDIITLIISKKHVDIAYTWISRIYMAMFDLELYTLSADNAENMNEHKLLEIWKSCASMSVVPVAEYDRSFNSFMHIVGDYSGRYYGYLLSRAIGNVMYKKAVTQSGALEFKKIVLESGGSRSFNDMYYSLTNTKFSIKSMVEAIAKDFAH